MSSTMIIAVSGLPGSGKTTMAHIFSEKLGFPIVHTDEIRNSLFFGAEPIENNPQNRKLIYKILFIIAEIMVASRQSVILDGTFPYERYRNEVANIASKYGIPCFYVECTCPETVLRERLERRSESSEESAGYDVYLRIRETYEPFSEKPFRVDTSSALTPQVEEILCRLPSGSKEGH